MVQLFSRFEKDLFLSIIIKDVKGNTGGLIYRLFLWGDQQFVGGALREVPLRSSPR